MHIIRKNRLVILIILVAVLAVCFVVQQMKAGTSENQEFQISAEILEPETVAPETMALPLPVAEEMSEPETIFETVPNYFQTDYPYTKFGIGTLATDGCSMTCLAMVASYLMDHAYTPDEMAYQFDGCGKTYVEFLEYGNQQMGLPCQSIKSIWEVLTALEEGKVVIALVSDPSVFTDSQHFIVITGMTEDGKVLVNDPMKPNYTANVYLCNGFTNGFEPYDIMKGFTGGWIYDKKAMPEEPFVFDCPKPKPKESRYTGYELDEVDKDLIAGFVWTVAQEEPEEVQQAIAEVILNRLTSDGFPNLIHQVIYRGELHRFVQKMKYAKPDAQQYRAVEAAVYGPHILPRDVFYFSRTEIPGEFWGELGSYYFLYAIMQ